MIANHYPILASLEPLKIASSKFTLKTELGGGDHMTRGASSMFGGIGLIWS